MTYFLASSTMFLQICLIWMNLRQRHFLGKLQDECSVMFDGTNLKKSSSRRTFGLTISTLGLLFLYQLSSLFMENSVGIDSYSIVRIIRLTWLQYGLYSIFILSQVFILYLQLCCNIKNLLDNFEFNGKQPGEVLRHASKIIKITQMTSNMFSVQCFILIAMALILMVCNVYLLIDYAFCPMTSLTLLTHGPLFLGALCAALFLWILIKQSDDIKQGVWKLKQDLRELVISDSLIETNGYCHRELYTRSNLIDRMSEFKGFDACGFATLGKPLLSSIFANFITYLIILIQFKIDMHTN